MSMLSGYPVGSKIVSDLYRLNLISKGQANRLAVLSSTSGPLFIIGAVGVCMFENKTIGFIMYISHLISVFLTALIFRNYGENEDALISPLSFEKSDNLLYDSVYSSVISAIVVGGFVSVFYVFSEIFIDFKILYPIELIFKFILSPLSSSGLEASAVSVGLIEFTKGCNLLSKIGATPLTVGLSNFLITFGGVSVIAQSLAFLNKAKVNPKIFIISKLISGIICFIICYRS
jgi:sporulation integral membrane protein YlbJ